MLETYVIQSLEQIKCLSDSLRIKIVQLLGKEPLTSQMLSEKLELPRSKVHYHLKELEKNQLIKVVKTEQVRNFTQIFYRAIAKNYIPSQELLHTMMYDHIASKVFTASIDPNKTEEFQKELEQLVEKFNIEQGHQVTISLSIRQA